MSSHGKFQVAKRGATVDGDAVRMRDRVAVVVLDRSVEQGVAEVEDDGVPFEEKMTALTKTLYEQMAAGQVLDARIRENLASLGYGESTKGIQQG